MPAQTILITGASSGLGLAISGHLVSQGHRIYAAYHHTPISDPSLVPVRLDVTQDKSVRRALAHLPPLDVLINCAARSVSGPSLNFTPADFAQILDINVIGPFRLIKYASPPLVINIASLSSFLAYPNFGIYSSSKFALAGLGQALFYELYPTIRVVTISPGAIAKPGANTHLDSHISLRDRFPALNIFFPLATPGSICRLISQIISHPSPRRHYVVGWDAQVVYWLQKYLPQSLFDKIVQYLWSHQHPASLPSQ